MTRVMTATPSFDGKIDGRFLTSFVATLRAVKGDYAIEPRLLLGDHFIANARNLLLEDAVTLGADVLVWIDADSHWTPDDFQRLLDADADFVGSYQRVKVSPLKVTVFGLDGAVMRDDGLLEVSGVGFGLAKMSRKCFTALYERAPTYDCHGRTVREVFRTSMQEGRIMGEDYCVAADWRSMGEHVYVHAMNRVGHISYYTPFDFDEEALRGT